MQETTLGAPPSEATDARLSIGRHLVIGLACALIAPWTGLAWPFALLTGMIIGRNQAERAAGVAIPRGLTIVRALAVTGGVLAMMVFGAVLGGLLAFTILALAAFSERVAADASQVDRGIARIIVFVVTAAGWFLLFIVLSMRLDIRFGG